MDEGEAERLRRAWATLDQIEALARDRRLSLIVDAVNESRRGLVRRLAEVERRRPPAMHN